MVKGNLGNCSVYLQGNHLYSIMNLFEGGVIKYISVFFWGGNFHNNLKVLKIFFLSLADNLNAKEAGDLSTLFDVGGIFGESEY